MLRSLDIRDILIIDRLELAFQPGLNVLTGETGAGKSILLGALGFVLGWRGRAELVRAGADQGEVIAEFEIAPDHPAHAVLHEAGIDASDELILRRVNTAEGRKTAWINDRRVSGEVLRALSDTLVELHGQHDDRGLLDPKGHRVLLDVFGGLEAQLAAVRAAWGERSKAKKTLLEAEKRIAALREEEDYLRHAVAELEALAPEEGEDATLDARRRMMQAAERLRGDVAKAAEALGLQGAEGAMSDALRWIGDAAQDTGEAATAPLEALERAMVELGEAQDGVARLLDGLSFNASDLEDTEERLFAIRGLARKHDALPDALGTLATELRTRLDALDQGGAALDELKATLAQADAAYETAAASLSKARKDAGKRLDVAMGQELAPLKMERAVFATEITASEPGVEGRDAVTFTVATNPGAPSGPLGRIASGGELSRFLLALKVCLTRDAGGLTLIFDEIDRGVGGATADAVGRRLKALAEPVAGRGRGQVLVVTHSPQVAALGDHHWRVEKRQDAEQTLSTVTSLSPDQREAEIARMLSGDTVTDEARAAAARLIGA